MRDPLADPTVELLVSAVSALEVATKQRLDRLLVAQAVVENATLVTRDAAIVASGRAAVLTW